MGYITLDKGLVFRAHTKLDLAVSNVLQVASFMQIVHLIWFVRSLYFLKGTFQISVLVLIPLRSKGFHMKLLEN